MITAVQKATIAYFKISMESLLGTSRSPAIVVARHVAWYLEYKTGLTYQRIAELYNLSDHTTIVAGCKHMIERLAAGDERYTPAVDLVEELSKKVAEGSALYACPTCGTNVEEMRKQLALIHWRLTELGAKP